MNKTPIARGILAGVRAEGDVKALIAQMNQAFAEFKAEHTAQLEAVKKGHNDALQALKVDKINADITAINDTINKIVTAQAAIDLGGAGTDRRVADKGYSDAFQAHIRKGEIRADLNKGTAAEGGYTTPIEWDRTIQDKLVLISPMRQLAAIQSISTAGFTKLQNLKGTGSGWVGETDARTETNTPTFGQISFPMGEIYATPAATQELLDDSVVDMEKFLAGEVDQEFSKQENTAFFTGNGTKKPMGLLNYATGGTAAASHPLGAIEVVASGAVGAITTDAILNLIYALPTKFTQGAKFVMNRTTEGVIRKLKDSNGNYIWQPSLVAGAPNTLCGYPIVEAPDMPNVAANALSIAFGNFQLTYLIVDRMGIRVLRDPYTNKPYVQFYTTKRVGGGLLNPEPMKFLKVDAA